MVKGLFEEYVELKSLSGTVHMLANSSAAQHRHVVMSYQLHQNANENPALQLDREFDVHYTELETRSRESRAEEIDRQIRGIELFHPEIKAEYAKTFPGKK